MLLLLKVYLYVNLAILYLKIDAKVSQNFYFHFALKIKLE